METRQEIVGNRNWDEWVNSYGVGVWKIIQSRGEAPEELGGRGEDGDRCWLLRFSDGFEVIATNAEPIMEDEDGFAEIRERWTD